MPLPPAFGPKKPMFSSLDDAKDYMTKPAPAAPESASDEGDMEGEDCASEVNELVTKYRVDAVQECLDQEKAASSVAPSAPEQE